MFKVEMLDAYEGDSLWITYGRGDDTHRFLIDAGRKETYREIAERIEALDEPLELFVITHVDDDHIFGAVPLLADGRIKADRFKDIWYNGYTHLDPDVARRPARDVLGPVNGEIFAGLLLENGFPWNEAYDHGGSAVIGRNADDPLPAVTLEGGMRLVLLSPGWPELEALKGFWEEEVSDSGLDPGDLEGALKLFEERRSLQPDVLGEGIDIQGILDGDRQTPDTKEPNGSSIAFLAEFDGHSVLFAGDAHPPVLEQSIRRLARERQLDLPIEIGAFKLSHHGSKHNTTSSLLDLVKCDTFLVSTNGSRHHHPDQEVLARVVARNARDGIATRFLFNHRSEYSGLWDDPDAKEEWNYETVYPDSGGRVLEFE